jgi:hypothetical protein
MMQVLISDNMFYIRGTVRTAILSAGSRSGGSPGKYLSEKKSEYKRSRKGAGYYGIF